ncbi:trehalose-phosphatase [Isoptericola sp. 4D.3]|uniref:Trehalose 6-phosphate phosphatase n=1 Tax=Isoptericola peretonis TaxID=2918523 RepID=A0ABT0J5D5_9MICO|nr:trehalose-phosphatase [Isoptericola sp. 4D.3]
MNEARLSAHPAPRADLTAAVLGFAGPPDAATSRCARLVALDFDGTLAPLVDDPATSAMTPAARAAVDRLATLAARPVAPGGDVLRLALVSGRNLTDLAARSAAPAGTYLVGSHGAESGRVTAHGVDAVPLRLTDAQALTLERLREGMQDAVDGRRGAWVQDKPSAAVLHTRRCSADDALAAVADADALAARLGLHAMHGKDVVEVAVVPTSKGIAVERLREETEEDTDLRALLLYAGDDTTDEAAFEVLGPGDLGLKVGPGPTRAEHRVADADALAALLERLADALEG